MTQHALLLMNYSPYITKAKKQVDEIGCPGGIAPLFCNAEGD
jgi:hypothetical protein